MRTFNIAPVLVLAYLLCSGGLETKPPPKPPDSSHVVTIFVDGGARRVYTSAVTVADVLKTQQITLNPLDRTSPAPDTPISEDLNIRVTRVTRREASEEVAIPCRTIVLADPDRPAGFTKILARGKDGRVKRTWRIWEKDGEVTVRGVTEERVLEEAADTIVLRGTHGTPSRGGDWRSPLRMEATAYYPGHRSCGRWATGYTATGVKAEKGVVAVDERVIPLGTRLYVPGYGFAIAADRGSAIKGMRIDLCFATYREAIEFGRQQIKVYVLD